MPFTPTDGRSEEHAQRDDLRIVEETDALVRRTLLVLTRPPAEQLSEGQARDGLRDLRPHLHEALAALGRMEQRRGLTDQDLARQRAFRLLREARA